MREILFIFLLTFTLYGSQMPAVAFFDIYYKHIYFIWLIGIMSILVLVGVVAEIILRQKLKDENYKNEAFLTLSGDGI
ncbi:MAG: hypothetical protein WCW84_12455, partial [Sulfurimonas sp.]